MTKQPSATTSRTLAEADREHILDVLKQTDWLIGGLHGAAARLGLPRTTLVYKMRRLGIEARRSHRARSAGHETPMLALDGLGAGRFEPVAAF
jgi:DNA-binding NtrC family response regulator